MRLDSCLQRTSRGRVVSVIVALTLAACAQQPRGTLHSDQGPSPATSNAAREPVASVQRHERPSRHKSTAAKPAAALVKARFASTGRYEFDQRQTEVRFAYTMANTKQRGRFTKVQGTLDYDDAAPEKAKISASIAAASLTTGSDIVDNELKGSDFFNVSTSPVIAFKSVSVSPSSTTQADVTGEITVNGITKPIKLKVSVMPPADPARKGAAGVRQFNSTTRIQRSAFKMTGWQALVDDEIEIEIAAIVRPV